VLATVAETGSSSFERRAGARQSQAREERRRRALRRGWISGEVERRLRADKVVAFCGASRNRSGMGTVWKKLLTSGPAMKRSWGWQVDPRRQQISSFKIIQKNHFPREKNRLKMRKNPRKFLKVENPIWNSFHYCNFFQIFTDFELIKRFQVNTDLTGLNSNRLIATLIANPPYLLLEQEVIHNDLKILHYDVDDMHKPTPHIKEDIKF
jgi:hypothetical protein